VIGADKQLIGTSEAETPHRPGVPVFDIRTIAPPTLCEATEPAVMSDPDSPIRSLEQGPHVREIGLTGKWRKNLETPGIDPNQTISSPGPQAMILFRSREQCADLSRWIQVSPAFR